MDFSIKEYNDYIEEEILNLYQCVGWINYVNNPTMVKNAYANSLKILGAYENEKLVGIIRVVGDGYSIVYSGYFGSTGVPASGNRKCIA